MEAMVSLSSAGAAQPVHVVPARAVLADLVPAVWWRTMALVAGGVLLTAAASQIRIPLGFTPVPINGGTFAVMVVGASLGTARASAAMGLYLVAGIAGMPFFADAQSGWTYATGSTGGYLLAYFVSAVLLGALAERGRDRRVRTAIPAMLAATVIIYALGALWLAYVIDVPVFGSDRSAWTLGVRPFLAGDVVKLVLAGLVLPTAWKLAGPARRTAADTT
jgi:biotin transport system substrate-specific component